MVQEIRQAIGMIMFVVVFIAGVCIVSLPCCFQNIVGMNHPLNVSNQVSQQSDVTRLKQLIQWGFETFQVCLRNLGKFRYKLNDSFDELAFYLIEDVMMSRKRDYSIEEVEELLVYANRCLANVEATRKIFTVAFDFIIQNPTLLAKHVPEKTTWELINKLNLIGQLAISIKRDELCFDG